MQAKSLGDMLRASVRRAPDKTAMLAPRGKEFMPVSYAQLLDTVRGYAGALRAMGIARGDKLAILSENCVEWAYTDWACCCLGVVTVPIYPSSTPEQARHIVCDSGTKLVVASSGELASKTAALDGVRTETIGALDERARQSGEALTTEELDREIDATSLGDVFTIIYTSGTTGLPKGAMLPHRASIHVCESVVRNIPIVESDVFLSFLPMSHVYERVAGQHLPICVGGTVAYARSLASLASDMQRVRPTVLLCVPRFLESLRERVLDSFAKMPPLRQKLFKFGLAQGIARAQGRLAPLAGIMDKLAMAKVRERTGGRLRFLVSGGAALAPAVAEFYMGVGLTVLQGYGLTETAGGTCVNHPDRNKYWTVGEPLDMEIRIAPDGEILIRGEGLMLGYHNLPDETMAAIDAEGWFHTGDIGEFEGSSLKITDRKKDLIVLANGKNVAPQPIENRLRESPYIVEAVLFGDGMDAIVALVVPAFEAVRHSLGLAEDAPVADNPQVRALIKSEIEKVNKRLAPYELVKRFEILASPFSVETGELTPTLKVKRRTVFERYRQRIESMGR